MAKFRDILNYFRPYWGISIFSIAAASIFEIVDLVVPYVIGQILNVLSGQALDGPIQNLVHSIAALTHSRTDQLFALAVLLGLIFLVTVVRAPLQVWLSNWFHWAIALRARRDHTQKAIEKILTLPLEFYDENNPGRIAGRVARGVANLTWTYPEIAGQLIPKLFRVLGIFVLISLIEWRIAILFLISFILILSISLKDLLTIIAKEEVLDKHQENTDSRTSEIVTNIKTVKAFATEASELKRQRDRLNRELKVVLYSIHLGYVKLATWQRTVIQICVFGVLAMTLDAQFYKMCSY